MKKKTITKTMLWAAVALIVPLCGQLFVDGWNWQWHEFLFAWVFFVVLGLTSSFVTSRFASRSWKIITGVAVFLAFAAVWVLLATG